MLADISGDVLTEQNGKKKRICKRSCGFFSEEDKFPLNHHSVKPGCLHTEKMALLREIQNSLQKFGHRSPAKDLGFISDTMKIN